MPSGGGFVGGTPVSVSPGVIGTHYHFYNDGSTHKVKLSKKGCLGFLFSIALTVLLTAWFTIGFGVGFGAIFHDDSDVFSPGDSRLLSLPSFFCEGGTLELSSSTVNVELFRVNTAQALNAMNNFIVTLDTSLEPKEFRFFEYYLYPNSNFTIFAQVNLDVDVYIVKGDRNAQAWERRPRASLAERFYPVQVSSSLDVTFQVTEEDAYFVYFYNSLSSSRVSFSSSLSFERFEYSAPQESEENCTVSLLGQCALSVPYGTGVQRFLVLTSIPDNVDYSENVELSLYCSQRGWAYALVTLLPMLVTFLVTVLGAMACYRCYKKQALHVESVDTEELIDKT